MKQKLPLQRGLTSALKAFGERLRQARLRRKFGTNIVSARAGISRMTLFRIESGDNTVGMGYYAQVLHVLGLAADIDLLAKDDVLGRRLQDLEIPVRRRAPKRIRAAKRNTSDGASTTGGAS